MKNFQIKSDSRKKLRNHFVFFLILFIPYFIYVYLQSGLTFVSFGMDVIYKILELTGNASRYAEQVLLGNDLSNTPLPLLVHVLFTVVINGIMFICINAFRNREPYQNPVKQSLTIFSKSKYFWGALFIFIVQAIWITLWSLLLVVPGIIKSLAYSQAIFIYRDALDKGQPIGFVDAITQSRQLMVGYKWQYFWLSFSFIGWWLVVIATAGLAILWVGPYYHLTLANFYDQLSSKSEIKNTLSE